MGKGALQGNVRSALEVYVDIDHTGRPEARGSTSGDIIMHGCHGIKTWSAMQQVIALSSGELWHGKGSRERARVVRSVQGHGN